MDWLRADEYERIYRAHGQQAADAEFNRRMRGENIKLAVRGVVLAILAALAFLL